LPVCVRSRRCDLAGCCQHQTTRTGVIVFGSRTSRVMAAWRDSAVRHIVAIGVEMARSGLSAQKHGDPFPSRRGPPNHCDEANEMPLYVVRGGGVPLTGIDAKSVEDIGIELCH